VAKAAAGPIVDLIHRVAEDRRVQELPDQQLLQRFQAHRDQTAFQALLRRHGPMVLDVCRGVLANEADVEDAFQATFLILARKAGSIRKTAALGSWLHGVASRTALKARAQSSARQKHEARTPVRPAPEPDDLSWREVRQVVHEELGGLPERYRAALVLCYLEGATQEAAAVQLGLAKSTLRERLERGRALLRTRLMRRGLGPAALLVAATWPAARACASVPPALIASTAEAAAGVAAGSASASVVSARVAALTEGVLRTMFLTKLQTTAAAVLLALLVVAGSGVLLCRASAPGQPQAGEGQKQLPALAGKADRPAGDDKGKEGRPPKDAPGEGGEQAAALTEPLYSVAFSPDNNTLAGAAGGQGGKIFLWDAASGEPKRTLTGHPRAGCAAVAFSPDGKTLASAGGDRVVRLWDPKAGKLNQTLTGHRDVVRALAYSRDGKLLASGGQDGAVCLWEVETGELKRTLKRPDDKVFSVSFSPDGKTLAAGVSGGRVRLWDVLTGELTGTLENKGGGPSVAFSPDGKLLATAGGAGKDVKIWDVAARKVKQTFAGHTDSVVVVAFSPDGKKLVSGARGPAKEESVGGVPISKTIVSEMKLWDADTGELLQTAEGDLGMVLSACFSTDGGSVAYSDDGMVRVIDVKTGKEKWKLKVTPE
jgi:RNA polymerase sigma factor (sigma-70 family)